MAEVDGEQVLEVRADRDHPVSQGYTCPKGRALREWHDHQDRLNEPLIRRDDRLVPVSWADCLDDLVETIERGMREAGADGLGVYTGTAGMEDVGAMLVRVITDGIGSGSVYSTLTVDTPAAMLLNELASGTGDLLPQPDPQARLTILLGINPMVSHGHNFFMSTPKKTLREWAGHGELWVIDPRRTATADIATRHLAPIPGTEYLLLAYLVRELLRDGADRDFLAEHVSGIDTVQAALAGFGRDRAARATGLDGEVIDELLSAIRRTGRIAVHQGTGITMGRAANVTVWLVYVLNAVTGSLDRPGGIWFNPGYFRRLDVTGWTPASTEEPGPRSRPGLPSRRGEYPCAAMADEVAAGNLRSLLVVGGNPLIAFPNATRTMQALRALDALAVIDVIGTPVTDIATHVLPAAGQLERADVMIFDFITNTEFAQYTPRVIAPRANRRPLWWILAHIGRRLGLDVLPGLDLDSATDEDAIAGITAPMGIDTLTLREEGVVVGRGRTFGWVTNWLPAGRWQLAPPVLLDQLHRLPDPVAHPLLLIPGRQLRKLNSQMSDGTGSPRHPERPSLHVSPRDAASIRLQEGDAVTVRSAYGSVDAVVLVDDRLRPGVVQLPHGYAGTNVACLTSSTEEIDPLTGMVLQSGIPVTLTPLHKQSQAGE